MQEVYIETPLGITAIKGDKNGIASITVLDDKSLTPSKEIPPFLNESVIQLHEYFSGKRTEFAIKLNLQGTDCQKKVWNELLNIPFGKTISYLDLSKKLGDVKAIRAVAATNGKNPIWIVIPCHRVIGSDGSLTGYAGGLWRKKMVVGT